METVLECQRQIGMVPGGLSHSEAERILAARRRLRTFDRRQWILVLLVIIKTIVLGAYAAVLIDLMFRPGMPGRDVFFGFHGMIVGCQLGVLAGLVGYLGWISRQRRDDLLIARLAGADDPSP